MTSTKTRRISNFADKLREALEDAALPSDVRVHVDSEPDPSVWMFHILPDGRAPGRGYFHTDAHDRQQLDPALVVSGVLKYVERTARDPRFTEASREADRVFADKLTDWLALWNGEREVTD